MVIIVVMNLRNREIIPGYSICDLLISNLIIIIFKFVCVIQSLQLRRISWADGNSPQVYGVKRTYCFVSSSRL